MASPRWLLGLLLASCGGGATAAEEGISAGPSANGVTYTGTCAELSATCEAQCTESFDDAECRRFLTGDLGTVTVPSGRTCHLYLARLSGDLVLEEGAAAIIGPGTLVCGDVRATSAFGAELRGTEVCGNLSFSDGGGLSLFDRVEIAGTVEVASSDSSQLDTVLMCGDASWSDNREVLVELDAAVVVIGDCAASANVHTDFEGLEVIGTNGCADP